MRLLHSLGLHSLDQSHSVQLAHDINANNQVAIAAAAGIAPLVQLAIDGTPEAKEQAAGALGHLAAKNADNQVAIAAAGGIEPLVQLAIDGTLEAKRNAAGALANLAADNVDNQVAIAAAGGFEPLVQLATDGTPEAKRNAAGALGHLAAHQFHDVQLAYKILRLKMYWLAELEQQQVEETWLTVAPWDEDDPKNTHSYVCQETTFRMGKPAWVRTRMYGPPIPENPKTSNADLTHDELNSEMRSPINGKLTTVAAFHNTFSKYGEEVFTYRNGLWQFKQLVEKASHLVVKCCPNKITLAAYANSETFTCDEYGNLRSFEYISGEQLTPQSAIREPTSDGDLPPFKSKEGNLVVLLPLSYTEKPHWNSHEFVTIGYAFHLLMECKSLHKQYDCAEEYPSLKRRQ